MDIVKALGSSGVEREQLFRETYAVKLSEIGGQVSVRALIEMSNICSRDCYYCGIRRSNCGVERFIIEEDEVFEMVSWARSRGFRSVVLQSGERSDRKFTDMVSRILERIQSDSRGPMGITLSMGEQSESVYRQWFEAGASRYLLRIESSDPGIFRRLHPAGQSFSRRVACLGVLKSLGYQVGTGIMIGLPGQSFEDVASDIAFFQSIDVDMLGMGPYIPHGESPLGRDLISGYDSAYRARQLDLGLKLIACCRLVLRDVNIAASTALQALGPEGRRCGLAAGANVLMPNVTRGEYRSRYQLYEGKPFLREDSDDLLAVMEDEVLSLGERILWDEFGDSPHFRRRNEG